MDELTPIYRIEQFLDAWLNSTTPPEPIYRIEYYLAQLAGADVVIPSPIYRIEMYLAKLCGEDVEIPAPIYRVEYYLAKLCGEDVEIPDPIYRAEYWFYQLAGGGDLPWTTFVGNPLKFDAPKAHALKSCVVSIEPIQSGSGDPSPDNVRPISGWTEAHLTGTGVNIFGGNLMRDGVLASMASATDHPEDRYVSFGAGAISLQGITVACGYNFAEQTRYTFILTIRKTVSINTDSNLKVYYTDGTSESIPAVSANNTKETVVYVSKANKTIRYLGKSNMGGTTNLYYDESGIFEGDLTADDFVAYQGSSLTIPFGQTVYGGTASYEGNGIWRITPFPEYDSYNGETLVGPWQSSIDKYIAGTSPTIGAQVVDKGGADPSFTITTAELFDALQGRNVMWTDCANLTVEARGTAVELNALQSLNILLGNRYINNHTEDDVPDEEALQIILGENR